MAKFRALLWREWRLMRKSLFISCGVAAGTMVIYWLIGLSARIGNLRTLMGNDSDAAILQTWFGGRVSLFILAAFSAVGIIGTPGTHPADIHANWLRYSFGLPISPKLRAAVRWTMVLLQMLFCFVLNVINMMMARIFFDVQFTGENLLVLALMLAIGLLFHIFLTVYPLSARTHSEYQKRSAFSSVVMMMLIIMCILSYARQNAKTAQEIFMQEESDDPVELQTQQINTVFQKLFSDPCENFFHTTKYFAVPGIFVMTAAGYLLTVQAYKRREDS